MPWIRTFGQGERITEWVTLSESKQPSDLASAIEWMLICIHMIPLSGLICFRYPGIDGSEEGIYEVIGHEGSKETLEAELGIGGSSEQMTDTLKSNSINKHAGHDDDAFSENDSQATHRNGAMTMPSTPITFPRTPTSTGKSDTLSPASAGRLPAMSRTGSIASSLHSSADASNGDIDGSPSSSSSTTKRLRKRISSSPALKLRTSLFRPSTKNKG